MRTINKEPTKKVNPLKMLLYLAPHRHKRVVGVVYLVLRFDYALAQPAQ